MEVGLLPGTSANMKKKTKKGAIPMGTIFFKKKNQKRKGDKFHRRYP